MKRLYVSMLVGMMATASSWAEGTSRPIVLELFTSQGCSSCPPADRLLKELAANPDILPLSLHVHYWDYLGWKDTFSSLVNTQRQRSYAHVLQDHGVYTPEMVIDGKSAAVGSNAGAVNAAIEDARKDRVSVPIILKPDAAAHILHIHIAAQQNSGVTSANIYALHYVRNATTPISAGENNGATLTSINNVTDIQSLGVWKQQAGDYQTVLNNSDEGIAILLQSDTQGRIIGAAHYAAAK